MPAPSRLSQARARATSGTHPRPPPGTSGSSEGHPGWRPDRVETHDVGHARRPQHHRAATPPPDGVRRLRRGPGGHIGGVAAGLGRYLNLDPNVIRVGFVIASVLAGVGVVAYLAAWLLIPRYDDPTPDVIRLERGPRLVGGAILATVAVVLLTDVGNGHVFGLDRGVGLLFAFALVSVGAYLLTRTPGDRARRACLRGCARPCGDRRAADRRRADRPGAQRPVPAAAPTRGLIPRPSWITPLTLGAITVVAGIMLALDLADVADPGHDRLRHGRPHPVRTRAHRLGLRRPRLRADPRRPPVRRGAGPLAVAALVVGRRHRPAPLRAGRRERARAVLPPRRRRAHRRPHPPARAARDDARRARPRRRLGRSSSSRGT